MVLGCILLASLSKVFVKTARCLEVLVLGKQLTLSLLTLLHEVWLLALIHSLLLLHLQGSRVV